MALTLEKFLLLLPNDTAPEQLRAATISDKGIKGLPPKLAFLRSLKKLIVSKNSLTDLGPLSAVVSLFHLDLSRNANLSNLAPLRSLDSLTVLNISFCKVSSLRGLEGCRSLAALVANDNIISLSGADGKSGGAAGVANFEVLTVLGATLETVILSRNPGLCGGYVPPSGQQPILAEGGDDEAAISKIKEDPNHPLSLFASTYFPKLKKISLSECEITSLPPRWFLPLATEVRLARNRISYFPSAVIMRSVKILDMSHNQLEHYNSLRRQRYLQMLSIQGNPLGNLKEYQRVRSERAAPSKEAASGHTQESVTIAPLEVLFIRSSFPDLTHLDGVKLTDPPGPTDKKVIQHAIHALQKKMKKDTPSDEAKETAGGPVPVEVPRSSDEELGPEPETAVSGKQRIRRLTAEFDPDEDGLMDESLLLRRRRRQEEDGSNQAEASPMIVKKPSAGATLKGARLRKAMVQEGAVVGEKRARSEEGAPLRASSSESEEENLYVIPQEVRAALQDPTKGAANLVKRERAIPAPSQSSNQRYTSRASAKHPPTVQGASALAALRAASAASGGW